MSSVTRMLAATPAQLSGSIFVILEPCIPMPAIKPFWLKMKARYRLLPSLASRCLVDT